MKLSRLIFFLPILLLPAIFFLAIDLISAKTSYRYNKWTEKTRMEPRENRYTTNVECIGKSPEKSSTLFIPYSENEKVDAIHIEYLDKKSGKIFKDSLTVINSSLMSGSFYQNLRTFSFEVPATPYFRFTYKVLTNDVFLFSALDLNPMSATDTVIYDIEIPEGFALRFKQCNIDSSLCLVTDSVVGSWNTHYLFTAVNIHGEKTDEEKKFMHMPAYLHTFPAIKTTVVPVSERNSAEDYLNNWYQHLYSQLPDLSKNNFNIVKAETGSLEDTDVVIKNIFRFVQDKIKYLDIENGINAFRPRDPNAVLENKQGDCKDMAFLIYSILKKYGINSFMAMSASITHPFDMDFPCLASANHIICTVNRNGKWIFMDATETNCEYGFPSSQIQGKHIFITGKNMATYVFVNPVTVSENETAFKLAINVGKEIGEGKYTYSYKHSGAFLLKNFHSSVSQADFDEFIHSYFKDLTSGCEYGDITTTVNDSMISFSGKLKIADGSMSDFSAQHYFTLSFVPYLDGLTKEHKIPGPIICYSTLNKKSDVRMTFEQPLHLKNARTKKFSEDGFDFEINVKQEDPVTVTVTTILTYGDVIIPKEKLNTYRKMIVFITSELNKGIVYE